MNSFPDREELEKLGPLSLDEKLTAGALIVTVALWIFGGQIGIGAVAAALLGKPPQPCKHPPIQSLAARL